MATPEFSATRYSDASKRGKFASFSVVRRELNRVINATPTQIHPDQRGAYITAILDDLQPNGRWTKWPEDVHHLALLALKVLGRNPVGSEVLLEAESFSTLVFHTGLQLEVGAPLAQSKPALEAMRALANILVLVPASRPRLAAMGGCEAIARALSEELSRDHLFLVCRVGFLITADGSGVRPMVEGQGVVPLLVKHIQALRPVPSNYDALSEVLKFTGNVIRAYTDRWDDKLNPLLSPLLQCMYGIEMTDLIPPLTHALHALLSVPFLPELLPTWSSAPIPIPETPDRPSTPSISRSPSPISRPTSPRFKELFRRVSRRGSHESTGLGLHVHSRPSSIASSISEGRRSFTLTRDLHTRSPSPTPAPKEDPSALPQRLLVILAGFMDARLKGTEDPNPDLELDAILPPVLLLASNAARGNKKMRAYFRTALFPPTLDRSAGSQPLEKRPGLLGSLLRLLNSTTHPNTRDTVGELLWNVCNADAHDLCDEIGYGIAAGLMFRKGFSGPPEARVTELPDDELEAPDTPIAREWGHIAPPESATTAPDSADALHPRPGREGLTAKPRAKSWFSFSRDSKVETKPEPERHPITALDAVEDDTSPFAGMTEEEKEAEAERMYVLFDRLSRNPVLSAGTPQADGSTKSLEESMREQVSRGVGEQWEVAEAERERARIEKEEMDDEAEALREVAAYRARSGRK